jgi:HSP20 family molecular chaperone IbpA
MKSYACYPGARLHPLAQVVNPGYPRTYNREYRRPTSQFPATNIIRTETGHVIEMAVPGLSKDQLTISIENEQLTVAANATAEATKEKKVRQEFDYTTFKRVFRLHSNANTEAMSAAMNNGVLTINIPDSEPEVRNISIQ